MHFVRHLAAASVLALAIAPAAALTEKARPSAAARISSSCRN